jgi:mono/diheme cytochrome c family protein
LNPKAGRTLHETFRTLERIMEPSIRIGIGLAVLLAAAGMVVSLAHSRERTMSPVQRGEVLVRGFGCGECHTPKVPGSDGRPIPDPTRLLSGHPEKAPVPAWRAAGPTGRNAPTITGTGETAFAGPWGISFAANLTPDKATGLGKWTEAMFIQALRTGKHEGQPAGREIMPPMPWASLSHGTLDSSDADLKAIWAYLRSLPPIKNQVPEPVPSPTEKDKDNGEK